MRARRSDATGFAQRAGVRLAYEVHGSGERTILLLPTWQMLHSRMWKMQVHYLARHFRVVTFDARGSGRSDRPSGVAAYATDELARDALAVLDATDTARATVVAMSCAATWATLLAVDHPERVEGLVYIGPAVGLAPGHPERQVYGFEEVYAEDTGWATYNAAFWQRDYRAFLEFFVGQIVHEPHSTKAIEDGVGWGLEVDPATLADATRGLDLCGLERFRDTCARVSCPVLVIHGDEDRVRPLEQGRALAEATGGRLVVLEGSGHAPHMRDPVRVNLLLRSFAQGGEPPPARWRRARLRGRRALFVSSPIGLGHAQRDLAIADELRRLHPDLEIDWLAQHPLTETLRARGERVHPASAALASEAAHLDAEAGDHALHVFQAWRRMDEILLANFMVFHDVVRAQPYDLWYGDEAWELDYYLHENPELKHAPYAFVTDFVGWLPMPGGGDGEAAVVADYNAENIGQVERYPWVRDAAVLVGDPEDLVDARFGPGLPRVRDWVPRHFAFSGYVLPFDPAEVADVERVQRGLGLPVGRPLIVAAVGGSAVGLQLLRRIAAAFALLRRDVPEAELLLVCGPRVAPETIEPVEGMRAVGYVHDLFRVLACCDLAVVHGGLTTAMELVATRRPFITIPLRDHFEQHHHVAHRLRRYGAPAPTPYEQATPERLAALMGERLGAPVAYAPVAPGGAARAAALVARAFE